MQKCFEEKDIGMLQEVIAKMDPKDAEYHIKRCVDSGKTCCLHNVWEEGVQTAPSRNPCIYINPTQ